MPHFQKTFYYLSVLLTALSTTPAFPQTPAPATQTQFALPLSDNTSATAIVLPTQNDQAYLVYSTPTGKIGLYLLTPTTPNPQPDPIPPVPPTPTKLTIAIVENPHLTTQSQRQVLSDPSWRHTASQSHTFKGIIPTDIKEIKTGLPPADLSPFLNRAKDKVLPWVMFTTSDGTIIWEGTLPPTAKELNTLITKYGG